MQDADTYMDNLLILSLFGNQYPIVEKIFYTHKNDIRNPLVYLSDNSLPENINLIDNLYQLWDVLSIDTEVANIVLLLLPYLDFYNRITTNGLTRSCV